MNYPPVVIVDEHDHEIGLAPLSEVWLKGLYHRIVSVFIQDDQGRMLLQLRSPHVAVYPNCWDQAAGGHVDEGQTYEEAAHNELREETGLEGVELVMLGTFRSNNKEGDRIINQFERCYVARVPHDVVLRPEAQEVSGLEWFTPGELRTRIAEQPKAFTPGVLHCLSLYFHIS